MNNEKTELKVVKNVWDDFLLEFHSGELVHDQILIITDQLLLRGPNLDLMRNTTSQTPIN